MDRRPLLSNPTEPGVAAYILTYKSPDNLAACVAAVREQNLPAVLTVVDNGGGRAHGDVDAHLSRENDGPAGGWAAALEHFLTTNHERVWLLDDDCHPEDGHVLAALCRSMDAGYDVVFPKWVDWESQVELMFPAWCGVLLSRESVTRLGMPLVDLVWWAEDTEYLQVRVQEQSLSVDRVAAATVWHRPTRRRGPRPAWKYYYEARNTVWLRVHRQRSPYRNRWRRAARSVVGLMGAAISGPSPLGNLAYLLRGVGDGLRSRLGRRFTLG